MLAACTSVEFYLTLNTGYLTIGESPSMSHSCPTKLSTGDGQGKGGGREEARESKQLRNWRLVNEIVPMRDALNNAWGTPHA